MRMTIDAWLVAAEFAVFLLAEAERESGPSLTATRSAASFWLIPTLLIAVVVIVGLIARQRERARSGIRDV